MIFNFCNVRFKLNFLKSHVYYPSNGRFLLFLWPSPRSLVSYLGLPACTHICPQYSRNSHLCTYILQGPRFIPTPDTFIPTAVHGYLIVHAYATLSQCIPPSALIQLVKEIDILKVFYRVWTQLYYIITHLIRISFSSRI